MLHQYPWLKNIIKIAIIIYFIIGLFRLIHLINSNKALFTEKYDYVKYLTKFHQSQWMTNNKTYVTMSDSDLYTFAASTYLLGKDPTYVNFETPPLGKYMIAVSLIVFNNQRIIFLIYSFITLLLIFYLAYLISNSYFCSLLAMSLTLNCWFFHDQIIYSPQMEILQLYFLILLIIFLIKYQLTNKYYYLVLSGIAVGAFCSLKAYIVFILFINLWLTIYFYIKNKNIFKLFFNLLIINLISFFVLSLAYVAFFINGGSLIKFLLFQKWTIAYYTIHSQIESSRLFASYLTLIFINRWKFWSKGYPVIQYAHWSIWWPISYLIGMISMIYLINKKLIKKNSYLYLLTFFIIIYSLFLLFIPIWPRYLLLLYVPLYIVTALLIKI